jgi:hypothetical protein
VAFVDRRPSLLGAKSPCDGGDPAGSLPRAMTVAARANSPRFGPAVHENAPHVRLYTSVLKYFRPESAISVTTLAFRPSRFAT